MYNRALGCASCSISSRRIVVHSRGYINYGTRVQNMLETVVQYFTSTMELGPKHAGNWFHNDSILSGEGNAESLIIKSQNKNA